jgi:hypothetical protein
MNLQKTNWCTKFLGAALMAIAVTNTLAMGIELLPASVWDNVPSWFDTAFFSVEMGLPVLFGLIYSIYWHKKEKKDSINSLKLFAIFLGIIRYWLAFEICTYGFAKILGTQFQTASYQKDTLLGNASGFTLTWYYFGYSYMMACIIAGVQIIGSIFLLFRRTTLLGAFMLLPVMLNILLINMFYSIASGAFINSIIFTISLLYIISLYWSKLKLLFFQLQDTLPSLKFTWFRHVLKGMIVLLSFLFIQSFLWQDKSDKKLKGSWLVQAMIKNGDTLSKTAWLTDSLCYSKLYFDGRRGCSFSPNPYVYRVKEARRGPYTYDETTHQLKVALSGTGQMRDSLKATITAFTKDSMLLSGTYLKDTIVLLLKRENRD